MSISLPIFSLLGWLEVNTSLWGEAAGSATAPRLCRHEDAFSLPHIVASLQCGVIENVTARAVVRRVSYECNGLKTSDINRASGYRPRQPCRLKGVNPEALADGT